jgi:hypothetical protein
VAISAGDRGKLIHHPSGRTMLPGGHAGRFLGSLKLGSGRVTVRSGCAAGDVVAEEGAELPDRPDISIVYQLPNRLDTNGSNMLLYRDRFISR